MSVRCYFVNVLSGGRFGTSMTATAALPSFCCYGVDNFVRFAGTVQGFCKVRHATTWCNEGSQEYPLDSVSSYERSCYGNRRRNDMLTTRWKKTRFRPKITVARDVCLFLNRIEVVPACINLPAFPPMISCQYKHDALARPQKKTRARTGAISPLDFGHNDRTFPLHGPSHLHRSPNFSCLRFEYASSLFLCLYRCLCRRGLLPKGE